MGVVYRARDQRLDRPVAIKILPRRVHRDPEWRARFLREARVAARLNHPNLATIYEIDEAEAPPTLFGDTEPLSGADAVPVLYIAMEYIEGEDLKTRLHRGPLEEFEVVDFGLQIVRGLEAAHRAGIVHRDLKPHNLRLTTDGTVKILDFGLAKMLEAARKAPEDQGTLLTTEGMILGTAPYMSPEQVAGEAVDARSDLFSLGVVLYEMAGGRVPYEGDSLVRYVRNLTQTEAEPLATLRPGVSSELDAIVEKLLEKEPDKRYASATDVREDLLALVDGSTVSAVAGRSRVFRAWRRRRRIRWIGATALVLAMALAAGFAWWSLRAPVEVAGVAVLPFENQTSDPGLDAYYEGIGTALIRKLAQIPGVNVVPELDVRRYRDSDKTTEQIAEELDVGTLIQGYVQGGDEEIAVGVQMVGAASSIPLWGRVFEGRRENLLTLQEQIADGILRFLPVSLSQRERARLRGNPTESREAWDAYFRGLALLEKIDDRDALERAAEYFERAVAADPEFAWAHAGLSEALWWLYRAGKDPALLARSTQSIERALTLSPDQPELWLHRARLLRGREEYEGALEAIEQALRINPDLGTARQQLAITQWDLGRPDQAKSNYQRAIDLRPTYWSHWNEYGAFLVERNEFEEAQEALERARELAPPGVTRPLENLGSLALSRNDMEAALEYYETIPLSARSPNLQYNIAVQHLFSGDRKLAREALEQAIAMNSKEPAFYTFLGDLLLQDGEVDPAMDAHAQALRLVEEQLAIHPGNLRQQTLRTYLLARTGACPAMRDAASDLHEHLPAEQEIYIARAYSVCGDRQAAVETIDTLLDAGVEPARLRVETELRDLVRSEPPS